MWTTLIENIKTTLDTLTGSGQPLQVVYDYPEPNITGYPVAIFFPASFTNAYDSNVENKKAYSFSIFLLTETRRLGLQTAYNTAMPELVDAVIAKFDEDWNQGQTIVGEHRVIWTLESGAWGRIEAEKETYLQAELTLTVSFNSNV
jgi:hypothetical protein